MVASAIKKVLKPLTKKIVDKLRKNPEDLTRAERKAVRDHQRSRGKTYIDKDGIKVTKYPYMGEAGQAVAKRPKFKIPGMKKGGGVKKLLKDIDKKTRREEKEFQKNTERLLNKEDKKTRREEKELQKYLNKTLGMKKGGAVKKCKVDGIAVRGKTKAKHK